MTKITAKWLHHPETQKLVAALSPLRFVGGCVRDAVLGRESKDIDVTTPLLPEEVIERLAKAGIKAIPTGIDHGTVTAVIDKQHFEITTLRRDVSTDGRRATVAYTQDWKEDAARRDFTMNALYCDTNGEVTDYFNGLEDAHTGCVRFIGDARERINEDALRILRFFRFFAHYGKDAIDVQGLAACGALAAKIKNLSGERIAQEMMKLLVADNAADVVILMQQYNVWPHVVPERVGVQTLRRLPGMVKKIGNAPDAILALAALLRSTEPERISALIAQVAERWRLSKANHRRLDDVCAPQTGTVWKKQLRAQGKTLFIDRTLLLMAEGEEEEECLRAIELARSWEIPAFPVSGDDLIALGFKSGKEVGEKLKALENAWEESDYSLEKKALLALAK